MGELTIGYSEALYPIDTFYSLDQINSNIDQIFDIKYYSQLEVDEEENENDGGCDDQTSAEKLPELISYQVVDFDEVHVKLMLEFTNKMYVSSQPDKDYISLQIKTPEFFMSKSDNMTLKSDYKIRRITVPTQILSDEEA
jgi:hypothetical protein